MADDHRSDLIFSSVNVDTEGGHIKLIEDDYVPLEKAWGFFLLGFYGV